MLEVAAFMVDKPWVEDGRRGKTWSCHVRSVRDVTVTTTDRTAPGPEGDVRVNNPFLRTASNEPRNCIDIESDFGFENEPEVFSLSFSISYQEEYFAPGFTSI